MADLPALPDLTHLNMAKEIRSPLCRDCAAHGPWQDTQDRTSTVYADWAVSHAAATGHLNIADLKLSYSPGRIEPGLTRQRRTRSTGKES